MRVRALLFSDRNRDTVCSRLRTRDHQGEKRSSRPQPVDSLTVTLASKFRESRNERMIL